ncbi:unnamed protein product [Parajaminaea phylloscopi]
MEVMHTCSTSHHKSTSIAAPPPPPPPPPLADSLARSLSGGATWLVDQLPARPPGSRGLTRIAVREEEGSNRARSCPLRGSPSSRTHDPLHTETTAEMVVASTSSSSLPRLLSSGAVSVAAHVKPTARFEAGFARCASTSTQQDSSAINVSLVLSRQPLLLRDPHPLEKAVFDYNYTVSRRLAQPFSKEFYFRKGSAAETRFDREEKHRQATVDAQGSSASQSGGTPATSPETEELGVDAELYATRPRKTEADAKNDVTSLERALDRTLFLVMRSKSSPWRLPTTAVDVAAGETLHKVAKRPVEAALGDKMDIWLVSNMPVAVLPRPPQQDAASSASTPTPPTSASGKTYFLRGQIISGLPQASQDAEFAWLTQEEIQDRLAQSGDTTYYEGIQDLLSQ